METKTQECEKSKRVFETIITLLGQKAEVAHKYTGKNIVLNVTSEDPGRLIGRRGIALNSITHHLHV
jgi:predicted RNA-binding protein Jag